MDKQCNPKCPQSSEPRLEDMTANTFREPGDIESLLQKVEIVRTAWKPILVSFLTLGVLGCGILYTAMRPIYSSRMVLPLTSNLQALIHTDAILDPVARKIHSMSGLEIFDARLQLASKLVLSELKKGSGLFSISVTDHSAQTAQATLSAVLDQIIAASKPSGTALASAQEELESQQRTLTELKEFSAVLRENASRTRSASDGEQYARSFVTLVSEIAAKEQRIKELQNQLYGFRVEDVIVPPGVPSHPDPSSGLTRGLSLILLVSLILPISFVLLRDAWRRRTSSQLQ